MSSSWDGMIAYHSVFISQWVVISVGFELTRIKLNKTTACQVPVGISSCFCVVTWQARHYPCGLWCHCPHQRTKVFRKLACIRKLHNYSFICFDLYVWRYCLLMCAVWRGIVCFGRRGPRAIVQDGPASIRRVQTRTTRVGCEGREFGALRIHKGRR